MNKKYLSSFIACLTFLTLPALADYTASGQGYRDLRVLHEFDPVDFSKIDGSDQDWAVLRVVQGPFIPEDQIPDEAGDRARQGSLICDLVNADATPVATLRGKVAEGNLSCFAPVPARLLFGTVPAFMRNRETGPCICRVNTNIPGASRAVLEDSRLIPEAWVGKVKPAYDTWRTNRDAFTQPIEGERQQKLIQLSKDENPVTSYMAYRRLADTDHLPFTDVPDELLEARGQLGVFVLLHVLHSTPQSEQEHLWQRLAKTVDSAKSVEALHGMATACSLELCMRSKGRPDKRASYNVLTRIEKRIEAQAKDGKRDEYFEAATEGWLQIKEILSAKDEWERKWNEDRKRDGE